MAGHRTIGVITKVKLLQKICGEPPAMNNQNARYNRNIGAQKRFY